MRYLSFLFLSLVILTGAGCSKPVEPVLLPEQPERESENMVGDVPVVSVEINKEFVLNEFAECKVNISYPSFNEAALPNQVSAAAEREVFKFIANALNYSEDVDGTTDLDALADNYLEICRAEIEAEYQSLETSGEELFTNLKRSVDIVYNIKLNEFHLLTVGLDEYSYTGGAHPNQRMQYLNIDRGGDRLLTLGDVISPEHLKVFMQYERAQLLNDNREALYQEIAEEYDALIEDQSDMTPEAQLENYGNVKNFLLTPTSIATYYNSYDIAPYAAGPIFVDMPYADVLDYLAKNGPLLPLIENLE